jgi:hypothetical protein
MAKEKDVSVPHGASWGDIQPGMVDGAELAAAIAGDGLQQNASTKVLDVDVSDFAGDGLKDDGSENLKLDIHGLATTVTPNLTEDLFAITDESAANDPTGKVALHTVIGAIAGDGLLQDGTSKALGVDVSDFAGAGLKDDGAENLIPDIHGLPAAAAFDVAADNLAISDESVANDPTGYVSAVDFVAGIVGDGLAQNSLSKKTDLSVHNLAITVTPNLTEDLIPITDESAAGDPTGKVALHALIAAMVGTGLQQNGATKVLEVASVATAVKVFGIRLSELRKQAAWKDASPDAPDTTSLGVADAAGSLLTGTQTNTNAASESAAFAFALPDNYVNGDTVTVRVRAKVSATRFVSQTVDVICKLAGDTFGSDICETAAQTLTTSYANYDFVITPTGLVAGDVLWIEVYLATNDTGGSTNGTPTATAIQVRPLCYTL